MTFWPAVWRSAPVRGRRSGPGAACWLVAMLALAGGGLYVRLPANVVGQDYYQFWLAGRVAHEEAPLNIWEDDQRIQLGRRGLAQAQRGLPPGGELTRHAEVARQRQVLQIYSTPWLYTVIGASASGRYERDIVVFQRLSLLSLAGGTLVIARHVGLSWTAAWGLLAVIMTWFRPANSDFGVANVGRLQLGLVALHLWLSGERGKLAPHLMAGGVLGMAVLFKPTMAYVALALTLGWSLLGRWRKLVLQGLGAVLGALAAVALSGAWFGTVRAWGWWLGALWALREEYDAGIELGNLSLARLLDGPQGQVAGLSLGALLLGLLVLALLARRRTGSGGDCEDERLEDAALAGLGAALLFVSSRLVWFHYYVLGVPLMAVALRPSGHPVRLALGVVGIAAVATEPAQGLLHLVRGSPGWVILVGVGTIVLTGLCLLELVRSPGRQEAWTMAEPAA